MVHAEILETSPNLCHVGLLNQALQGIKINRAKVVNRLLSQDPPKPTPPGPCDCDCSSDCACGLL